VLWIVEGPSLIATYNIDTRRNVEILKWPLYTHKPHTQITSTISLLTEEPEWQSREEGHRERESIHFRALLHNTVGLLSLAAPPYRAICVDGGSARAESALYSRSFYSVHCVYVSRRREEREGREERTHLRTGDM